jgi:putative endopeptidase
MSKKFSVVTFIAIGLIILSLTLPNMDEIGIKLEYMNTDTRPGDDFNEYANGVWLKNNPVPATENRWGSFNEIEEQNFKRLLAIVNEVSLEKKAKKGSDKQLVGTFYRIALDSIKANMLGMTPIKSLQDEINAVSNKDELIKQMARFHKKGIRCGFGFYITSDLKNSKINTQYLSQGGFNLPDKEYFFQDKHEIIRNEYLKHIRKSMALVTGANPTVKANGLVSYEIEKRLASSAMNSVEKRDIQAQYNPIKYSELKVKYPNLNWDIYFKELGTKPFTDIVVEQLAFFTELNNLFNTISIEDWKSYMQWQLINSTANFLGSDIEKQDFGFFQTVLRGTKEMKPRWKRALDMTDNCLGEPLGKLYVEKYFTKEAKDKVNQLVDNLTAAYRDRIISLSWMSESTKTQALSKLNKIIRKLGYPDVWKDHKKLLINEESYCSNVLRCNEFGFQQMIDKIGKPVDRTEWGMSTPTVNAYYNPSINEIVFPAGIMQLPFFDANRDDAANYGGIGAIIGHELTHGFDDQGSQFDGDGNMNDWWTSEDKKQFNERTSLLVKQFNGYIAIDTLKVNGELTLGENIADLGGLTLAYYAYKKSLNGSPSPIVNGLSGEQRLFISWAQGWKNNIKPEALKQRLATDPHSPAKFRILGPMSNMQEFYDAFQVNESHKMYLAPNKRSLIW